MSNICVSPLFISVALLLGLSALTACDKLAGTPAPSAAQALQLREGDLLLARSNCVACHAADRAIVARAGAMPAPSLANVGDRLSSAWIARELRAHPRVGATGMRMPNVLTQVPAADLDGVVGDLAAYLGSLHRSDSTREESALADAEPATTFPAQLKSGERLIRTLGCAGCHPSKTDGILTDESWLKDKWIRRELVEFLLNPASVWPGGQMPNFDLSRDEATAIASYLLRGQGRAADGSFALAKAPGVSIDYYEGEFAGTGPAAHLTPTRMDSMIEVDTPTFARADAWGARIHATLTIPTSGRWMLALGSDDGASLSLDGTLLMESPGVHGFDWKFATRELEAGPHELLVTYFEGAGNADLRLEWKGPGVERERIPASAYTREAIALRAPQQEVASAGSVEDGRALFVNLGCVQCHGSPAGDTPSPMPRRDAAPLALLNLSRGCLAENPVVVGAPDYEFTPTEREALRARLSDIDELVAPLPADESLALHLLALNCTACHVRDGVGAPSAHALALFEGTADIGEQGRVPPTLTGAGAKLRTGAIDEVLAGNGSVRPYLLARMPRFGREATAPISALFASADSAPANESDPPMRDEITSEGRQLVGTEGFACITCHGCAGYPAAGVPAIDLSYTYARIRHSWFEKYMRDPAAIYPGTRMPTFWQPGQRAHTEILGGDPAKQISAIWSYLALGSSMPLPKGMVPGSAYELAPTTQPIMLGTFMDGLSARCIAVGFSDQLHFVYDIEHRRAAKAWRGRFMDAAGTWFGRAGLLCEPAGLDVIEFAPGAAIALLESPSAPWPLVSGRESGWQFLGVDRNGDGVPTFRTRRADLEVEEHISPAAAIGGAHLIREFVIRSKHELSGVTLRAWAASAITKRDQGWKAESGPTIFSSGGGAFVRPVGVGAELLIPVGFSTGTDPQRPYEARIRLEYAW